jgi:hypothetical protein
MLASTQETLLIKKVNSILIQAAKSFKTTTQREAKKGKNRKEEDWLMIDSKAIYEKQEPFEL